MHERRQFERRPTSIRVEILHDAFGKIVGYARDISDGGASVMLEGEVRPPVGTEVKVIFKKVSGTVNEEPVAMKIVHQHRNLIGLMFCGGIVPRRFF
ncbi:PilZ domain-containing protein [Halioxenophilus sp. WMMB6]|uniref:PilZ domain-containing protein n=1 Tax=Halioxenophilus sp. WMMB6 TaxID=3073815 RepID=UPI00295E77C5|nr:PilZ domain-containing protein [Halioxenophilus sp. WMMB6]